MGLGEGEKESSRQFPLPLGGEGWQAQCMAQGQSVKGVGHRGHRNVSAPPGSSSLPLGVSWELPLAGLVGQVLCLSVSFVSLSLSALGRLRTALASNLQGALFLLPSLESGPELLLLSAHEGDTYLAPTQWMFRS